MKRPSFFVLAVLSVGFAAGLVLAGRLTAEAWAATRAMEASSSRVSSPAPRITVTSSTCLSSYMPAPSTPYTLKKSMRSPAGISAAISAS